MREILAAAQRWHYTDHGQAGVGSCWCCCRQCNPDSGERPNPFWSRAVAAESVSAGVQGAYSCILCGVVYESVRELLKHVRQRHC